MQQPVLDAITSLLIPILAAFGVMAIFDYFYSPQMQQAAVQPDVHNSSDCYGDSYIESEAELGAPMCAARAKQLRRINRAYEQDDSGYASSDSEWSDDDDELSRLRKAIWLCRESAMPRTPQLRDVDDFEAVTEFVSFTQSLRSDEA